MGRRALVALVLIGCSSEEVAATPKVAAPVATARVEAETEVAAVLAAEPVGTAPGAPAIPPERLSPALRNAALHSPMPGGSIGGWYGDTGVDISGRYLPVYAMAAGTLEYSEWGHTLWKGKGDTPFSVRIRLDTPIAWKGRKVTHLYYTHLSAVATNQPEGATVKKHVVAGEPIATSGIGNGVPHLHLGLLLDDRVEQDSWEFILREDAVRAVMGDYRNGETLPAKR